MASRAPAGHAKAPRGVAALRVFRVANTGAFPSFASNHRRNLEPFTAEPARAVRATRSPVTTALHRARRRPDLPHGRARASSASSSTSATSATSASAVNRKLWILVVRNLAAAGALLHLKPLLTMISRAPSPPPRRRSRARLASAFRPWRPGGACRRPPRPRSTGTGCVLVHSSRSR